MKSFSFLLLTILVVLAQGSKRRLRRRVAVGGSDLVDVAADIAEPFKRRLGKLPVSDMSNYNYQSSPSKSRISVAEAAVAEAAVAEAAVAEAPVAEAAVTEAAVAEAEVTEAEVEVEDMSMLMSMPMSMSMSMSMSM